MSKPFEVKKLAGSNLADAKRHTVRMYANANEEASRLAVKEVHSSNKALDTTVRV
jgi:hypothetical protein